jgi:competence protein ComEA
MRSPLLVGGAAGLAVLGVGWLLLQVFFALSRPLISALPRPTPAPIVVQIGGAVAQPGLYELPASARIDDAVRLAGGLSSDADGDRLNLTARLTDGQRVNIPRRGELPAASSSPKVSLNRASQSELEALPGIGTVTAQRILARRREAPFSHVDELLEERIVNAATFARLQELIAVD